MYRSIVIIEVFLGAVCLVLGVLILGFQYEPFPGSVITLLVAVLLLGALSLVGAAKAPLFSAPSNSYRPTLAQQWFFTGATLFLVTIPRQSRGHSVVSRSKRLVGVANAAPHSWSHRFGGDSSP